jgi:PAS domain S-box-containing protein
MIRGATSLISDAKGTDGLNEALHLAQVEQTMRFLPLLVLFHGIASGAIHLIANESVDTVIRSIWPASCLVVAIGFVCIFLGWRLGPLRNRPTRTQGLLELLGLALGIVWAMPVAAYAVRGDSSPILPLIAISLAVMGVTSMSLLRTPIALVVFLCVMTAALARSAYTALPDYSSMSAAIIVLYGLVLLALTITSHAHFVRHTSSTHLLKQQHDFTAMLLNNLEEEGYDWLWETNAEGKLVYASPRLAEQLGVSAETLQTTSFRGLLSGRLLPKSWQDFEIAMQTQIDFRPIRLQFRHDSGDMAWLLMGKAITDELENFKGFRGVGRDVSAQNAAEKRTQEATRNADAAAAAKSRFLSVMSHELRTPVNAVIGFAELLSRETGSELSDKARREFTHSILEQARILQGLINDLLDATRLERGSVKLIEQDLGMAELAEIAIHACSEQAHVANVSIVANLAEGVDLWADSSRVKQALINVLSNAIKFSMEGGIVNIDMQKTKSGELVLEVRDAGVGIASGDIERLFEPFSQADDSLTRRYNGLGLGLVIARKIMRLHEGELSLSSVEGAGTTARFVFPPSRLRWHVSPHAADRKFA